MSFERFTPDDFIVSSDAISATAWTTGAPTLITFFTSCKKSKITMNPSSYLVRSYNFTSLMSKKIITFPKFVCNYPQCCSK